MVRSVRFAMLAALLMSMLAAGAGPAWAGGGISPNDVPPPKDSSGGNPNCG